MAAVREMKKRSQRLLEKEEEEEEGEEEKGRRMEGRRVTRVTAPLRPPRRNIPKSIKEIKPFKLSRACFPCCTGRKGRKKSS